MYSTNLYITVNVVFQCSPLKSLRMAVRVVDDGHLALAVELQQIVLLRRGRFTRRHLH